MIYVWIFSCKSDSHQFILFGWFESKLLLNVQLPKWALIIFHCIKDNYLNLIKKLILEQNVRLQFSSCKRGKSRLGHETYVYSFLTLNQTYAYMSLSTHVPKGEKDNDSIALHPNNTPYCQKTCDTYFLFC